MEGLVNDQPSEESDEDVIQQHIASDDEDAPLDFNLTKVDDGAEGNESVEQEEFKRFQEAYRQQ